MRVDEIIEKYRIIDGPFSSRSGELSGVEKLEKALNFYADPLTYYATPSGKVRICAIDRDYELMDYGYRPGKKAREALKENERS